MNEQSNDHTLITLHFDISSDFQLLSSDLETNFILTKCEGFFDNYFELLNDYSITKGFWLKHRIYGDNKQEYLVKRYLKKEKEEQTEENKGNTKIVVKQRVGETFETMCSFLRSLREKDDNVEHNANIGLCFQEFCTIVICRNIYTLKQDENVELHICSAKLDNYTFYNYGKLKLPQEKQDKLYDYLNFINNNNNSINAFIYNNSSKSPVIERMFHMNHSKKSEVLEFLKTRNLNENHSSPTSFISNNNNLSIIGDVIISQQFSNKPIVDLKELYDWFVHYEYEEVILAEE
ncbi:hypothetical protein ABK040_009915 [Willaertia magna]